ncbi:phycobilisome rod-core linker polypeptide [Limnofasciculus baicalensis]|uniref:Phycobilisome rod-core linker polypeptide n=1 Tax=Limnofasciculus baicalensis BBK-W-15 TaxID=2699891 RepID=A0AAE3GRN5_9CYAN|nr:phycobilisome rod-core linker polypeptide [Limnofasciculus baicalensis]MCP2728712.1 phycobilisome rod-core linker polypeptide [Limnofasciculus baicalensis BBK-W-15]
MSSTSIELWPNSSIDELQTAIRAVYKQVLGNPHVMDSERLVSLESLLCDRSISVREFVRGVGKSEFYRTRYFEKSAPYRFVELNFMHFLGRAPSDQKEISEHIVRCIEEGYDAEIDSYIDSDEYQNAFGENIVPYNRATTLIGKKQVSYNRLFSVDRGSAQVSSAVKASQLVYAVATNSTNKIQKPASGANPGGYAAPAKQFKIVVQGAAFDSPRHRSSNTYIVPGDRMTPQIQRINRTGAKIVSITEIV